MARRIVTAVAVVVLGQVAVAGCAPGAGAIASPVAGSPVEVQVAAAASLREVLETATTAYAVANPGIAFTLTTDSSAALRTKIEQGAPVDLFLSADTKNPQALVEAGLADGPVTVFAGNRLTVIVPVSNPAAIGSPADLARDGVKIVAAAEGVPVTAYATTLVETLAGLPGYPAGFAEAYAANVVSREDNVSAVVAKIALGEGDAAIAYATDARANPDVAVIEVPDSATIRATYGAVVLRDAAARDAARAFLSWLTGPEGQGILRDAGFEPAP